MISISAHISAANSLRGVKSSIENLVSTLRSAQSNIYPNEVEGLDSAITQLENIILECLRAQGQVDSVANSIIAAAKDIYEQELAEQRRLEEELRKKAKNRANSK